MAISTSKGFCLIDMDNNDVLATYQAGTSRTDFPKPIRFCEARRAVVVGSDHGKVYVFDKQNGGHPVDTLVHSEDPTELVQSITVRESNGIESNYQTFENRVTTMGIVLSLYAQHRRPDTRLSRSGNVSSSKKASQSKQVLGYRNAPTAMDRSTPTGYATSSPTFSARSFKP